MAGINEQVFEKFEELFHEKYENLTIEWSDDRTEVFVDDKQAMRNIGNLTHSVKTVERLYGASREEAVERIAQSMLSRVRDVAENRMT